MPSRYDGTVRVCPVANASLRQSVRNMTLAEPPLDLAYRTNAVSDDALARLQRYEVPPPGACFTHAAGAGESEVAMTWSAWAFRTGFVSQHALPPPKEICGRQLRVVRLGGNRQPLRHECQCRVLECRCGLMSGSQGGVRHAGLHATAGGCRR